MEQFFGRSRPHSTPKNLPEALVRFGMGEGVPSAAAVRLASALAERLDAVVPPPFRIRAEGGWVSSFNGARWDGSSDVAGVLDSDELDEREAGDEPEDSPFAERVVSISQHVLSSVQDMIAEATTEPWPRLPDGKMANPGARADADRVYLWYGPDSTREGGAVLSLPHISLVALKQD